MKVLQLLSAAIPDRDIPNVPKITAGTAQLDSIVNGAFAIAGAILVLFVVIGALRYATSQGNPQAVQSAKEMIIYSFVGVVVVFLAFAIVQIIIFVVNG